MGLEEAAGVEAVGERAAGQIDGEIDRPVGQALDDRRRGGLAYRLVMTVSGLALALLGSLAVWTFWFKRRAPAAPLNSPRSRAASS